MSDAAHDVQKEVKIYTFVFGALLFLTVLTVGVSYLHFAVPVAIAIGLFIATIKASLVAGFFMHLVAERKLIYIFLILTATFFVAMVTLFVAGYHDHLVGTKNLEPKTAAVAGVHDAHHAGTPKEAGHH